jgi:dihydrofolate reductase
MPRQHSPKLTLVVAVAENGVIGRGGELPWRLSADLRRFKQLTLGKPIIMGRKTWESLGKPLPGRHNIVVTRREDYRVEHRVEDPQVTIVRDLDAALAAAGNSAEVMVIGGAEIYALALPRAEAIELTRVHARPEGDTFWPDVSRDAWREIARAEHSADERNDHAMTFITMARCRADASEESHEA